MVPSGSDRNVLAPCALEDARGSVIDLLFKKSDSRGRLVVSRMSVSGSRKAVSPGPIVRLISHLNDPNYYSCDC